jgi:HSP20 family protein
MTTGNITVQRDKPQQSSMQPRQFMRSLFSWDPFFESATEQIVAAFDVKDTPEAFVFKADVPGIKDSDIQVQFRGNRLTVSGKRESEERKQQEKYYTYERSYGSFARTFTLPETADVDKASADMKNGVLTITVPKKASERPRNVAIKSETKTS